MIKIVNVNQKYRGNEIVAIVKERDRYVPRGTYEYRHRENVVLFPGCDHPTRKVAPVTIPRDTLRAELVLRLNFFEMLNQYEKNGELYALFLDVGSNLVQPLVNALNELNEGKLVDLESILS